MDKIKNIEFLRVFFTFSIVFFHMRIHLSYLSVPLYTFLYNAFANGRNAVEAFFIIAGFVFFINFKKDETISNFILKKYIRFSPVIAFSVLLCVLSWVFTPISFKVIPNILTIFLLNNFGRYWCIGSNIVLWYTSALFFGLLLCFIIGKFTREHLHIRIFSFVSIFCYSFLVFINNGDFGGHKVYLNVFSVDIMRALGGIALGILIAILYKNQYFNKLSKIKTSIITLFEICSFSYVFWWLFLPHKVQNHINFVMIFSFLFILFLIKKGGLSNITNKTFWGILSKYSYAIFVTHYIIIKFLYFTIWKKNIIFVQNHPCIPLLINILIILILGFFIYNYIELPSTKYLRTKLLNNIKKTENY